MNPIAADHRRCVCRHTRSCHAPPNNLGPCAAYRCDCRSFTDIEDAADKANRARINRLIKREADRIARLEAEIRARGERVE